MPRKATKSTTGPKPKAVPIRPATPARRPKTATRAEPQPTAPASKAAAVLAALGAPTGATLPELMALTGWQAHSVRGFLSGTVRTKLGLPLTSEATPDGRRYRVTGTATRAG